MCKCCSAKTLIILATCTQCVLSIIVWRSSQIQEGCRLQIEIHHVSRRLDIYYIYSQPYGCMAVYVHVHINIYIYTYMCFHKNPGCFLRLVCAKQKWQTTNSIQTSEPIHPKRNLGLDKLCLFCWAPFNKKKHTSKFPCLTAASCLKMIKVQGARSRRRILLILRSGSANDLRIATSDGSNWQ